jgi:hypothetical protein
VGAAQTRFSAGKLVSSPANVFFRCKPVFRPKNASAGRVNLFFGEKTHLQAAQLRFSPQKRVCRTCKPVFFRKNAFAGCAGRFFAEKTRLRVEKRVSPPSAARVDPTAGADRGTSVVVRR